MAYDAGRTSSPDPFEISPTGCRPEASASANSASRGLPRPPRREWCDPLDAGPARFIITNLGLPSKGREPQRISGAQRAKKAENDFSGGVNKLRNIKNTKSILDA